MNPARTLASRVLSARPLVPLALLGLTAVLSACGSSGGTTPDPVGSTSVCPQSASGASLPVTVQPASVIRAAVPAPDWSAPHVPGRVLVLNADGTLGAQGLGLLSAVRTRRVAPGLTLAVTPAGEEDRAFAGRLAAAGVQVQPDFLYRPLAAPNDPGYPGNRGFTDGSATFFQTYLTRINASGAWDFLAACGKTPTAALTAVLDSGADGGHPDLNGRLLGGKSYLSTAATTDGDGHGTATAGLIGAATNNGTGLAGVTWSGQNLLPVKVLDSSGGSTSTIAQGVNYAVAQGARVINMSFGTLGNPGDEALEKALNTAAESAVLVAAAGNTSGDGVYYPASNANVIAVGAVGARNGALACYSARPSASLPRALDLVAPGGAGSGVCSGATDAQDMLVLAPGGEYALSAGTSEAAPLVSGVAALMRAANPDLTAAQTRALLIASANSSAGLPLLDAGAAVRAATR